MIHFDEPRDLDLLLQAQAESAFDGRPLAAMELFNDIRDGKRFFLLLERPPRLVLGFHIEGTTAAIETFWRPETERDRPLGPDLRPMVRFALPYLAYREVTTVVAYVSATHPHRKALLRLHRSFGLQERSIVTCGSVVEMARRVGLWGSIQSPAA